MRKRKLFLTEQEAYKQADELKALILKRIGLKSDQLQCPREKSDMTPCIARDGGLAVSFREFASTNKAICVGCETGVEYQLTRERAKQS